MEIESHTKKSDKNNKTSKSLQLRERRRKLLLANLPEIRMRVDLIGTFKIINGNSDYVRYF